MDADVEVVDERVEVVEERVVEVEELLEEDPPTDWPMLLRMLSHLLLGKLHAM